MKNQQISRKKMFFISVVLGFLMTFLQLIAISTFPVLWSMVPFFMAVVGSVPDGGGSDVSLYVIFVYGLALTCLLYSVWALIFCLKRHHHVKSTWSFNEKVGVWLQFLSAPVLLAFNRMSLLFLVMLHSVGNGGVQWDLMKDYRLFTWACLLLVAGILIVIGRKVYTATSKDLGSAQMLWGCALILFKFSFSFS